MKFVFFSAILFQFFQASSQNGKVIFAEAGGPGIFSLNYDTRLKGKNDGVGVRIGAGFYQHDFRKKFYNAFNLPLGINFLKGRDGKNFIELGAGITPVFASDSVQYENMATTFGHVLLGYRLQPASKGFSLRVFFSPTFGKFGLLPFYGGISMGYKFRARKKHTTDSK